MIEFLRQNVSSDKKYRKFISTSVSTFYHMPCIQFRWSYYGLLFCAVALGLSGCGWVNDVFPSNKPPQVLAVHLSGVPNENISIDQQKLQIIVLLPDTLSSLTLVPDLTLSKHANLLGSAIKIPLDNYCPCPYGSPNGASRDIIQQIDLEQGSTTSHYKIVIRSQAPLQLKPLKSPIVWDSKSTYYNIFFPVKNYYGSSYVRYIAVTKTGSLSPNWIGGGDGCFDVCSGRLNILGISISGYLMGNGSGDGVLIPSLKAGLYDLDLWLVDDTKIHATAAILVK